MVGNKSWNITMTKLLQCKMKFRQSRYKNLEYMVGTGTYTGAKILVYPGVGSGRYCYGIWKGSVEHFCADIMDTTSYSYNWFRSIHSKV